MKKHRGGYGGYKKHNKSNNQDSNASNDNNNNNGNADGGKEERRDPPPRRERGGRDDRHVASRGELSANEESAPPPRTERGRGRGRYDRGGRMDKGRGGGSNSNNDDYNERREDGGGSKKASRHQAGNSPSPGGPPDYSSSTTPPMHSQKTPPSIKPPDQTVSPPTQKSFAQDPGHVFPSTPYTPAVEHFLNPALRAQIYGGPPKTEHDLQPVTVAGSKFHHYINIKTYDDKPQETSLLKDGKKMQVYRATNRFSEKMIVIRRLVDSGATSAAECQAVYDRFRHFRHPNCVPLAGITQTNEFVLGSSDVIIEYRYIKGAKSFKETFFSDPPELAIPVPEAKLWSILCQMLSLVKTFHEVQVPLRGIHYTKMLFVESTQRVMFSGIGLVDMLAPAPQSGFTEMARQDLMAIGILILQLVAGSPAAQEEHLQQLILEPQRRPSCSPELIKVIQRLIKPSSMLTVHQICNELGDRLANEVAQQSGLTDHFYGQCAKEVHNGRLMKLMIKLNFVIGSFQDNQDWGNDANERFALRLFHSYLFNQVDDRNQPRIDWFRVYSCLNKLDVGSEELVQLISADGNSTLLVISYSDLKQVLETHFGELQAQQDAALGTPPTMQTPGTLATPATTTTTTTTGAGGFVAAMGGNTMSGGAIGQVLGSTTTGVMNAPRGYQ